MGSHLGIDLGTSSVKALVADGAGRTLGVARAAYPVLTPEPGWAEADPEVWWGAVVAAVRDAVRDAGSRPTSIGFSGQMHGVVCVDEAGSPLRPAVLWPDTRAVATLDRYATLDPALLTRLANPLAPGMAGPILCWLADHEADVLTAASWALQPKDWLRLRLTGVAAAEPSDASGTLLYDLPGDRWDDELVAALGLPPDLLAPLCGSADIAGELLSDAAAALGLDPGVPVAAGAADTAAGALGTGLVTPGSVQLTIGTGGQLITPLDAPQPRPEAGTHLYRAATPTGWYAMAATLNAGLALGWVRDLLALSWDELYAATETAAAPDDPIFVPHLSGERTPYLDTSLRGSWSGLAISHDRVAVARSALEGVAFALRDALEALPATDAGTRLRLGGGGSAHPGWRQLVADVLGRPLDATAVTDASARGAALLGAVAVGAIDHADIAGPLAPATTPVAEPSAAAALHDARFGRYRELIARLGHDPDRPPT